MSEKRIVFKKGKYIVTKKPPIVIKLSKKIYRILKPLSKKIEIAGSIRRKEQKPVDIDIIIAPKDKARIVERLSELGKYMQGGEKKAEFKINGIKVEIYFSDYKSWGAMLLAYTGPLGLSIGLRKIAREKHMLLNQYGLFKKKKFVASKTEKSIYKALGKKFKKPEDR